MQHRSQAPAVICSDTQMQVHAVAVNRGFRRRAAGVDQEERVSQLTAASPHWGGNRLAVYFNQLEFEGLT